MKPFYKGIYSLFTMFFFLLNIYPTNKTFTQKSLSAFFNKFEKSEIDDTAVIQSKLIKFKSDDHQGKCNKILKKMFFNAYNASIIENGQNYLLIFRHDTLIRQCSKCGYKKRRIKFVTLDKDFNQIGAIGTITLPTDTAEDARIHHHHNKICITYNDDKPHLHPFKRRLFTGELSMPQGILSNIKEIESGKIRIKRNEKNWTPFEYPEKTGDLYYIYSTSPYRIIKTGENLSEQIRTNQSNIDQIWNCTQWGEIRGGSPARLVDNVYLTFFHSRFYDKKCKSFFYVMGAYIFQPHPPFDIIAVTPSPIVFKEIYTAQHRINILKHIYPAGFVVESLGDNSLIHVSCGENDTSTRIVTIDKNKLFQNMKPVSCIVTTKDSL